MTVTDEELLLSFISEAWESIEKLDLGIINLEKNPDDEANIANIFRAIHTIKGSSGFFALKRIEKLTHAAETLLGNIRSHQIKVNHSRVQILLNCLDNVKSQIAYLEKNKSEETGDDEELIKDILLLASSENPKISLEKNSTNDVSKSNTNNKNRASQPASLQIENKQSVNIETSELTKLPLNSQENNVILPLEKNRSESKANENLKKVDPNVKSELIAPVKVSVELLDKLMNDVSELVLARNRLIPFMEIYDNKNFINTVRSIDKLTIKLQEKIIKTRMQQIGQLWNKLPRLVRDLSDQCNKKIEIFFKGEETELDRTLLDAIKDPLMHIIRNSIDHGIESPEYRTQIGKNPVGKIYLQSFHQNGMVVIEIKDDGQGLNYERIKEKAIQKNLLTLIKSESISEEELVQILFLPGFSTRDTVTNVSGRGVGMDVVKTNITAIGGNISIFSKYMFGMTCTIRIPLTLAIIPVLLIKTKEEFYSIPQINLLELVHFNKDTIKEKIDEVSGSKILKLRDKLLPLIDLSGVVGLPNLNFHDIININIAIIQTSSGEFGLVFDNVIKLHEVVIKALPDIKGMNSFFSGATILGDGNISLILDMEKIAKNTGTINTFKIENEANKELDILFAVNKNKSKMLIVEILDFGISAIPIEYVTRLDKVQSSKISNNAGSDVFQHESQIIKIIDLSSILNKNKNIIKISKIYQEQMNIFIYKSSHGPIAFVVNEILKIVDFDRTQSNKTPYQFGLIEISVIDEMIINILNMPEILSHIGEEIHEIFPVN